MLLLNPLTISVFRLEVLLIYESHASIWSVEQEVSSITHSIDFVDNHLEAAVDLLELDLYKLFEIDSRSNPKMAVSVLF